MEQATKTWSDSFVEKFNELYTGKAMSFRTDPDGVSQRITATITRATLKNGQLIVFGDPFNLCMDSMLGWCQCPNDIEKATEYRLSFAFDVEIDGVIDQVARKKIVNLIDFAGCLPEVLGRK